MHPYQEPQKGKYNGLVQKGDFGLWTGLLGMCFSLILLVTKAPGGKLKMEEDADVIVLSSKSDEYDITLCNEDVEMEYSSGNSESILFPISPAKKVFIHTKRFRSSPISDNSDSDDLGKSERYVFGLILLIKKACVRLLHGDSLIHVISSNYDFGSPLIVCTYDRSEDSMFSNSEDEPINANEHGSNK